MCIDLCLQATLHLSVLLWVLCSTSHLKWEVGFLAAICPPLAAHIDIVYVAKSKATAEKQ